MTNGSRCCSWRNSPPNANPERAQHHIERYRSIKRKMSALHAFRADKRLRALECYAEASVARAHGQPDRAILLLNEAFEIWSSIGYAWRGVVSSLRSTS